MACVGCVLCEHLAVRHYGGHTEQTELSLHFSFNPSLHSDGSKKNSINLK